MKQNKQEFQKKIYVNDNYVVLSDFSTKQLIFLLKPHYLIENDDDLFTDITYYEVAEIPVSFAKMIRVCNTHEQIITNDYLIYNDKNIINVVLRNGTESVCHLISIKIIGNMMTE